MSKILICGHDESAIEALKSKHGYLFVAEVKDEDGKVYNAICKEPTMEAVEATEAISKSSTELKASMVLFDNCVVACDEEIKSRFLLKVQVVKAIGNKMKSISVTTKNL
ncbi:hypothetical protein ACFOWM_06270 [Ferruginibacter yonginensis]|uniref:Dinitrogenase iron-molybdenum cofactor biosynthesis domain-containing protein n=1 Tax=Ferruginibacter yonginensis TaxID=1310416 RepID=A0ABV8QS78_9BACT